MVRHRLEWNTEAADPTEFTASRLSPVRTNHQQRGPDLKVLHDDIRETVISSVFQDEEIRPDKKTMIFINPDGPFVTGGPSVHSGLTGRKML